MGMKAAPSKKGVSSLEVEHFCIKQKKSWRGCSIRDINGTSLFTMLGEKLLT